MNFSVTFRHMEATEALKEYCLDKVDKLKKYFRDPISTHVILTTERGYDHHAEFVITLKNGILVRGEENTEDMYSSIDLAMAKIERQVRRWKDKIRDHKPSSGPGVSVRHLIIEGTAFEQPVEDGQVRRAPTPVPQPAEHKIVSTDKIDAKAMTVSEAVMQLNLIHREFFVFINSDSKQVNVVYRRDDGNYGLIEAPSPS
jgi:putative sigma-54 modulation protein